MTGQDFRAWREAMGWTQRQASAAFQVRHATVVDWEAADELPNGVEDRCTLFNVARIVASGRSLKAGLGAELAPLLERIEAVEAMPGRGRPRKE